MNYYLGSVESTERARNKSKELVHLLRLGGFKITKLVRNVSTRLIKLIDGSLQSTKPKVIASFKEESSHELGLK